MLWITFKNMMTHVMAVVGTIMNGIIAQPLLLFFLSASMIPVGIMLFRKLKRAAK